MKPNRIETKRQRGALIVPSVAGVAAGWIAMAALGMVVGVCAFFPDSECKAIFDAVRDAIWAR